MAGVWVSQKRDMGLIITIQLVLLLLFGIFTRYHADADAKTLPNSTAEISLRDYYPMFQDVHVMMFVGFGFLMTFLKRYGFSSVGFNMLVTALIIQWAMLCKGFFHLDASDSKIHISISSLMEADLSAAAVLISMGAVLGKTTPLQLLSMGIIETIICTSNEFLGVHVLKAVDAGASMYVHVFGAYFGLMVSLVLGHGTRIRKGEGTALEGSSYNSDLFAMIGTVFLWMFWPSFNGALAAGDDQHRAVINTYLSLASCCVTAFAVSALVSKENKFDMVHIQNATLAGGVAIGTSADMMIQPCGALAVGMAAGILSVMGYQYLQPALLQRLKLHDTCGVHNLHGMPGLLAGLIGAIMAGLASESEYNYSLYQQFPARAPVNISELKSYSTYLWELEPGSGRSAGLQAGYQLLALGITLLVALISGSITGFILKLPFLNTVSPDHWFSDHYHWEVPLALEEESKTQTNGKVDDEEIKTETTFCDSRLHI